MAIIKKKLSYMAAILSGFGSLLNFKGEPFHYYNANIVLGFQNDQFNVQNDFANVVQDFKVSFYKISSQQNPDVKQKSDEEYAKS